MINKFKPKTEFSRNVLTLMTGTTIAQAIPIAISPILTRLYTPEDFGILGLFIAIVAVFGTIINGKYELALMLPTKDEDSINILALGLIISFLLSLILFIMILIFHAYFTELIDNRHIEYWLYFIPLSTLLIGFYNMLSYYNTRKKYYKDISRATIIKSIVMSIIQLIIGFIKSGETGLITGEIISRLFANMRLLNNIIKDKILISKVNIKKMLLLGNKYKEFPIYNLPSSLADVLTLQLPFIFIPKIYDLIISGYFVLVQNIISIPSALIGKSISQVFFQNMTYNKNNNLECLVILENTVKKLFYISLPISICIYLFSPFVFGIIFGEKWTIAGEIAQYFSFIFFVRFVVSPVSSSFSVTMELKLLAKWQYLYLFSSIILFLFVMEYKIDLFEFLFIFVIYEVVLYLIYLYLIFKSVEKMDKLVRKRF